MLKAYKFFEIAYLIIAIVLFVEAIIAFSTDGKKALLFLVIAIMALFMFFFKRKFREKRFGNKNNS